MKARPFLFCIAMICFSCASAPSHDNERIDLSEAKSLECSLQQAFLEGDSAELRKILSAADSVLLVDTVKNNRYKLFMLKSTIYRYLGEMDAAYNEEGYAIELLTENHVDRYVYYGEKARYYGNEDEAKTYFRHALKLCNEQLRQTYDRNNVINAVKLLILLEMKDSAQAFADKYIILHPKDNDLKLVLEAIRTSVNIQ